MTIEHMEALNYIKEYKIGMGPAGAHPNSIHAGVPTTNNYMQKL